MVQQISGKTLIPLAAVGVLIYGAFEGGKIHKQIELNSDLRKIVDDQQKQIINSQNEIDILKTHNQALGKNLQTMQSEMVDIKKWLKRCIDILTKLEGKIDGR